MGTIACHLFIPGLSVTSGETALHFGSTATDFPTHLRRLVARADHKKMRATDPSSALLHFHDVRSEEARGAAPFMVQGAGIDVVGARWLCADPVHLRIEQDRLVLLDAEFLNPEIDESLALIETLNTHFADDGMRFYALSAHSWCMRLSSPSPISTTALNTVLGRDVHQFLPGGNEAMRWHRRFNELQMLLHTHPVNEAREQRGALPINSIWWWGEGSTVTAQQRFSGLVGNGALLHGLATTTHTPIDPLPDSAARWLKSRPSDGEHLIALESLRRPWAYRLESEWQTDLAALEKNWFAQLAAALVAGEIGELKISALTAAQHTVYRVTRRMLWRFWRH